MLKNTLNTILFTALFFIFSPALESKAGSAVPPFPSNVTVVMYRLDENGTSTGQLCAHGDKFFGCTAYCTDIPDQCNTSRQVAFPYSPDNNGSVQVLSNRYLLDVISQEMNPSILLPETAAITAQAVASRSLAGYFINNPPEQGSPPDVPFNNSTKYQVFIPYKWDSLNYATDPLPPTEPNPCAGNQGNQAQRLACGAIESGCLIAQHGTTLSAKALFFSDVMGNTATAEKPYLTSVEDPISGCDIYAAAHAWGMSQRGAIRWAKGNQCAGSGDQPWPVRWTDYRQILAHYYTGIDFLDGSGAKFAPDYRWNLLNYDAPQEMPAGQMRKITLHIQNTSAFDWDETVSLRWKLTSACRTADAF